MLTAKACPIPEGTELHAIAQQDGVYTDCFSTVLDGNISLADYVTAFYTTPLFKAERFVLRLAARTPSTDDEARQLGRGNSDHFAVWRVQFRTDSQLLMKAIGRTSSWFMIDRDPEQHPDKTRLLFGSVVMPVKNPDDTAQPKMGFLFAALLGGHRLYSRLLLSAAAKQLLR